jgi:uncharacterized repeat protein (TIGR03803 family)
VERERWRSVERLYHAALERDPGERDDYLQDACGADEALREEVEGLLAYQEQAADFIETPALEVAARQEGASGLLGRVRSAFQSSLEHSGRERVHFQLGSGAKLGPYEILAPLGSGGMGEIYSARDTRLGRIVAIKILTGRRMDQDETRRRFEREAQAISSLNHPNICILYDIGHDNDIDYLVMEYVEGQTLASRLKEGPLGLPELLRVAIEISEALGYAHRCGVIHRDLKPANIMLTGRGAKLVDFGLARWHQESEEINAAAPVKQGDSHASSLTMTGAVFGTPQYMAPEQLGRLKVDARTDIFAFGLIIFEMATGRKALEGGTAGEVAGAIQGIERTGLARVDLTIPASLRYALQRCLENSPEERWQTAEELSRELKRIEQQSTSPVEGRRGPKVSRWAMALTAVAIFAAAVAVRIVTRPTPPIADQVLYSFTGLNGDGARPPSSVTASENGILYGTTHDGGASGKGTVFELRPPATPGAAWTPIVLHSFAGGSDGFGGFAPVVRGARGELYGSANGGALGRGLVFELMPPAATDGQWTKRVLYSFSSQNGDGDEVRPGVVVGPDLATGRKTALYGTTVHGGVPVEEGRGTVFQLTPPDTPGGEWIETVLHRFTGENGDGAFPYGDLVFGESGTIYGTTFGGRPGTGTVFALRPPGAKGGEWKETVLHRFVGRDQDGDGASPVAGLAISKSGALYGTTQWGGISRNGTVFELKPPETAGGAWTYNVLHKFTSHIGDGAEPTAGLVIGKDGTLYGTTLKGGAWGKGTVFKLTVSSGKWIETVLYSFTGHNGDGAIPGCIGHLFLDGNGALYGTTEFGGASNSGTVFKLKP